MIRDSTYSWGWGLNIWQGLQFSLWSVLGPQPETYTEITLWVKMYGLGSVCSWYHNKVTWPRLRETYNLGLISTGFWPAELTSQRLSWQRVWQSTLGATTCVSFNLCWQLAEKVVSSPHATYYPIFQVWNMIIISHHGMRRKGGRRTKKGQMSLN